MKRRECEGTIQQVNVNGPSLQEVRERFGCMNRSGGTEQFPDYSVKCFVIML
jgi:hypothetical protein